MQIIPPKPEPSQFIKDWKKNLENPKLEFPEKWYIKNYWWADWVMIGVSILALGVVVWLVLQG